MHQMHITTLVIYVYM